MELKNFFVQDDQGNKLPGAQCYLYQRGSESPASGAVKANGGPLGFPFTADHDGLVQLAAPNGLYDLRVTGEGRDYRILLQFNDVSESIESAQAAVQQAELARDATLLNAGIKDDVAHGLLTTLPGQYFSVPSPESREYLILYKNKDGVAEKFQPYPSAEVVTRLEDGNFEKVGLKMVSLSVESGYLWALVDSNNRAAFLIDLSGAVVIPKFLRLDVAEQRLAELDGLGLTAGAGFKFIALSPESGYAWALVDANDRIALAVTLAGKVVGNFDLSATVGGLITSQKDLYFLGDSLTNGAGGQITWRTALADLVSPRTHTNIAIGGQTSPQIAARAGAYVTLLTLAGDLIPASGPVAVTARTIGLLTSQGQQSIKGRLSGVYGTLSRAGDDSYSFTRETAGAPVPVGKKLAFAPDIGTHGFDTWLIFMGANNIVGVADIKRDIAAAVNAMKPVDKRFLVMTPVTGDPANAAYCEQIEDWASQTYSDRVLKIREFSFQFNDGSAGDLADVAAGIIPRSLRIDGIHFTTFFHGKIAELVATELNRRGW